MIKRILLAFIFLSFSVLSYSQEDNYDINGLSVGFVPSALFNIWTGYQMEAGYGFKDHFEIGINVAYINGKRQNKPYQGYRIRPSIKYYFLNEFEDHRFYIEAGYLQRVIDVRLIGRFNMFEGVFFQEIEIVRNRTVKGGFAMFGIKKPIGSSGFFYDFGIGLGLGEITILNEHIPNGELESNENFFVNDSDGSLPFPILLVHASIGYNF